MRFLFSTERLAGEINSFKDFSEPYWDSVSNPWERLASEVKAMGKKGWAQPGNWEIPAWEALKTIPSTSYDRNPGHPVVGKLHFVWVVRGLGSRRMALCGNASISVSIEDASSGAVLMAWNFDIGDSAAPGSCFHAQVTSMRMPLPFVNQLPVPRLHSFVVTVTDAADFLLGELFQDRWCQHVAEVGFDYPSLWDSQRSRAKRLLEWKIGEVSTPGGASIWTRLKKARPDDDIFVRGLRG